MTRTYRSMAEQLGVPTCLGGCGLSDSMHERGDLFLGVVHWRERRWSRAGAKRYLMLVALRDRYNNPEWWNNNDHYNWMYEWADSVGAQKLAGELGFRLPAHLFVLEKERCKRLARRSGIHLSHYPKVRAWATR